MPNFSDFLHGNPKGTYTPLDPIPLRVVRVTIPASVAYDFNKMVQINKTVLGKLGCEGCHSGHSIYYDIQRVFAFNEKLELIENLRQ